MQLVLATTLIACIALPSSLVAQIFLVLIVLFSCRKVLVASVCQLIMYAHMRIPSQHILLGLCRQSFLVGF